MNILNWPPLTTVRVYKHGQKCILSIDDPSFDLSDALTYNLDTNKVRTARIGISSRDQRWSKWTDTKLQIIEGRVRYLFEFDGFTIEMERVCDIDPESSKSEYLWDLRFWLECT